MPLLDHVATYLDAQSTRFTVPTNLMKTIMLDASTKIPDTVTVLYETAGLPPVHAFSTGSGVNRLFERPTLEVMCRSTSYQTARANAFTVFTLLDGLNAQTLSSVSYRSIAAVQSPFPLFRDQSDRWVFTATYDVEKSTG